MQLSIIKLSLGSLLLTLLYACSNEIKNNEDVKKKKADTCKFYRYNAGQIISNLGCKNCHIRMAIEEKDEYGAITFIGLAAMDSLKIVDYAFTKKHKGWYSKSGTFKGSKMDTLSDCEIKSVIRYIKDAGRDIPMSSQ
ncbi:hypothetical protein ASE74_12845 [Pedobacter sp. Leaf216]|uniref:hypothetical protein n=1 Tax=Pedobacter sp. Leaf216 TaxID=1735684 RepID=UPI0006FB6B16|nr:hypothetical protein [Pedobacter sp. Leaf216]KQM78841.1 hypothetical protein ASE74_12845 [Pedobacter sp. Leaf216]